ncbi:hypothetical protein [Acutalibacter sp. 1XD8-36]|uniref:hypothetical protein n=1 Tax=Acutalibacter sp. 1XD8-36 TaxID=2320852 RepID=UPI0026269000|nr:hypothetical protein [Acutalibacter sp. 1XD8-36]
MSENQSVKKRDIPLSMLLLAANIAINWRSVPSLFTRVMSLGSSGVVGILGYLANAALTVVPIIMLVLVFLSTVKDKPVTKTVSLLCFILGAAFLLNFGLTLYWYFFTQRMDLYSGFPHFGNICALFAYGIGMIQVGSKLTKSKLRPQLRSYGRLFYMLMLVIAMFVIIPAFMDMTVSINTNDLLNNIMLIAAGFFLPATLLEDGKNSRPVESFNLIVTIAVAAVIYIMGGSINYSSYGDSHSMPSVTSVTCPVCHKKYSDNGNKSSINYSNMCKSCRTSYKATKDALGW